MIMKPSNLRSSIPVNSTFRKAEHEHTARLLIHYLAATGDEFRLIDTNDLRDWLKAIMDKGGLDLSVDEEAVLDLLRMFSAVMPKVSHNFKDYVMAVSPHLETAEQAALFSPAWARISGE